MDIKKWILIIILINSNKNVNLINRDFEWVLPNFLIDSFLPLAGQIAEMLITLPLEYNLNIDIEKSFWLMNLYLNINKLNIINIDYRKFKINFEYIDNHSSYIHITIPKFELTIDNTLQFLRTYNSKLSVSADEFVLIYELSDIKNYHLNLKNSEYLEKNWKLEFDGSIMNILYKFFNSHNHINKFGINILIKTFEHILNKFNLKEISLMKNDQISIFLTIKNNLKFEIEKEKLAILHTFLNFKINYLYSNNLLANKKDILTTNEIITKYLFKNFNLINLLNYEMNWNNNQQLLRYNTFLTKFRNPTLVNFNLLNKVIVYEYHIIIEEIDNDLECNIKVLNELNITNLNNIVNNIDFNTCLSEDIKRDRIIKIINNSNVIERFLIHINKIIKFLDLIIK